MPRPEAGLQLPACSRRAGAEWWLAVDRVGRCRRPGEWGAAAGWGWRVSVTGRAVPGGPHRGAGDGTGGWSAAGAALYPLPQRGGRAAAGRGRRGWAGARPPRPPAVHFGARTSAGFVEREGPGFVSAELGGQGWGLALGSCGFLGWPRKGCGTWEGEGAEWCQPVGAHVGLSVRFYPAPSFAVRLESCEFANSACGSDYCNSLNLLYVFCTTYKARSSRHWTTEECFSRAPVPGGVTALQHPGTDQGAWTRGAPHGAAVCLCSPSSLNFPGALHVSSRYKPLETTHMFLRR